VSRYCWVIPDAVYLTDKVRAEAYQYRALPSAV
ncbi:uncharacterized protein METZ01_LOCUS311492, partial [marine metagenome]